MELANLLVPSLISVIGFIVTICVMHKQFKNATKQKIVDAQRELYLKTYVDIEKVVSQPELIFSTKYFDSIFSHKGEIKLTASDKVIHEYESFLKYVHGIAYPAWKWITENHPDGDPTNYESRFDEMSGEEIEICHITDNMLEQFQYEYDKYIKEHTPESKEIKTRVESLLNKMREDLGNDEYKFS